MSLNIVMLGPPGAGKGTQARRLEAEYGIPQISTGGILRQAVQAGTELGRAAQAVMNAGLLVSDDIMVGIVRDRLAQPDTSRGFILDGFPRTVAQAIALDGFMAGRDPLIVINVNVPEEVLVKRLLSRRVCEGCGTNAEAADGDRTTCQRCGGRLVNRSDDTEAVVRERQAVYRRDTQPLIEYYRQRPTFRAVNGNQPAERVAADTGQAVEALAAGLGRSGWGQEQSR